MTGSIVHQAKAKCSS